MCRWIVLGGTVILYLITVVSGKIATRCFSCRSRGDLGDCKDPFASNSTSIQELPGKPVTTFSCQSGWCRKQTEKIRGPEDYFGTATERACLPRSPPDGEERCAEVTVRNNKVMLVCVCRGDLCNSAPHLRQSHTTFLSFGVAIITLFLMNYHIYASLLVS